MRTGQKLALNTVNTGYYFLIVHNFWIYTEVNIGPKVGRYDDTAMFGFPAAT